MTGLVPIVRTSLGLGHILTSIEKDEKRMRKG
jgi:hypothetical protein